MLITKFNKLVRSKRLWLLFAIIISISFLGVDYGNGGCGKTSDTESKSGMAGKLFGAQVNREEFNTARSHETGFRDNRVPAAYQNLLTRYTWRRIAGLQTAEKLGLAATMEEVSEQIWTDKTFQNKGQFDHEKYSSFIRNSFHGNPAKYENYVKESITLQKMLVALQSVYLMSPSELTREIAQRTDSISAEYVVIKPDSKRDVADVTEKDAEELYKENKETFRIPKKIQVKYAAFPIPKEISTNTVISESAIKDYYEENERKFSVVDTNKDLKTLPLEKVRDDITAIIRRDDAVRKLKDIAFQLVPDRKGECMSLEDAAAKYSATIGTTEFFSAREVVPGLDIGLSFNKAAFELDPNDKRNCVSDPVVSSNCVYIMVALTNKPARLPAFEEVKASAMAQARTNAQEKAFAATCRKIRSALKQNIADGKSFRDAAEKWQLDVHTTGVFSAIQESSTNDIPHAELIMSSVYNRAKNDITQPIHVKEGQIIVHVVDRTPAPQEMLAMMRSQMSRYYDNVSGVLLFSSWGEYLLKKGNFESYDKTSSDDTELPSESPSDDPNG